MQFLYCAHAGVFTGVPTADGRGRACGCRGSAVTAIFTFIESCRNQARLHSRLHYAGPRPEPAGLLSPRRSRLIVSSKSISESRDNTKLQPYRHRPATGHLVRSWHVLRKYIRSNNSYVPLAQPDARASHQGLWSNAGSQRRCTGLSIC